MEIFGIGPQELFFIVLIAIIVLGPKDMQKAGKTVGRWLNQVMKSDGWRAFQRASKEIRNLPTNLMREANMDLAEAEKDIRKSIDPRPTPPASISSRSLPQSRGTDSINQASAANPATESAATSDTTINTPEADLSQPNQNA